MIIFLAVSLVAGLGTAWYVLENGNELFVERRGPWVAWSADGRPDADPYTHAHLARSGQLAINATSARYHFAHTDGDGNSLDGDCEYRIVGRGPAGQWWTLSAYDLDGNLMSNPANRYALNQSNVMRDARGAYVINVSSRVQPGNWLPIANVHRFQLLLRVFRPPESESVVEGRGDPSELPEIRKIRCR